MPMFFLISFLAFWAFFLGSAFGSFLNVVVWRMPRGMSLSFPLSHCPKCGKPIRPRHNIPILGWLMLRGKCFDCRQPISRRYPTVEFLCGCAFLLIFWSVSPAVVAFFDAETAEKLPTHTVLAVSVFSVMAAVSFLTFFAAGLIRLDGKRVPIKIFIPFWVLCTAAMGFGELGFRYGIFPYEMAPFLWIIASLSVVYLLSLDVRPELSLWNKRYFFAAAVYFFFVFLCFFLFSCVWIHILLAVMVKVHQLSQGVALG